MGFLNIAQRLVLAAQDLTVSALLPVSTVAFSKVRDSPARLRSAYLRAMSISYAVATPLMLFVAVSASSLVPFLFGEDKTTSADITPALTIAVLVALGSAIDYGLHLGIGRPGRWLIYVLVSYTISVSILAYSVQFGLMVLVLVAAGTAILEAIGRWLVVGPAISASPWQVAKPMLGVVLPGVLASAVGMGIMALFGGRFAFLAIACTGLAVVGCYLLALRGIRPATYADTLTLLPRRFTGPLMWTLPKRYRPDNGEAPDTKATSEE